METSLIFKSAGVMIKNRRLLVGRVEGKDFFISPGGMIEQGETAKEALIREIEEEFLVEVKEEDLKEFGLFEADAAGRENTKIKMDVFIVEKWEGEPTPDGEEIVEIKWIESSNPEGIKLGSIFEHDVVPKLKQKDLID